ncbi:sulfate permease [Microbacterium sp. F2E]|uniref:sulfate permease n=1 Tax=Microbacterium sp. F2E TaxID=2895284 RepID=UPI001E3FC1CD|nr:sulfate permease [Microbacterium sp. F2E]MCC9053544.1 sulfate permease [Microbacterium sp. F2E]
MFRLIWALSVRVRYYLRRYMPTNILIDAIRYRRRWHKWGIPAMLLAIPYLLIAATCSHLAQNDGPGWLHLVALWGIWNALKLICLGPISVIVLIGARLREWRARLDAARYGWDEYEAAAPQHA